MKRLIAACAIILAATRAASAVDRFEPSTSARAAPRMHAPLERDQRAIDDFALRYYASLGQSARAKTELARLQRLDPSFEPPADLYTAPLGAAVEEEPLWDLFAADRLDQLRDAIAAKQKDTPGWRPSVDLAQKFERKQLRRQIIAFWRNGRWRDLGALARENRFSVLEGDVEILWLLADACARSRQTGDAFAIYKAILLSSKDRQVRLATVQKAIGSLRIAELEALLALGQKRADGEGEFQTIAADVTRARIAAFLRDERPDEIARVDLAQFEARAKEEREPRQIGLIAWYYYKLRDFHGALGWFELAIANGGDPMIAHGLAHTLRALEMRREAEEVAFAWREGLVNNAILFIDLLGRNLTRETPPFIEPERLSRYARVTMETESGEGAQALAWYAYNSCQFDVALSWFEKAAAWFPKEATVYGYALALGKNKRDKAVIELINRYDGLFPRVVELLFPDGSPHPGTPCERRAGTRVHGAAVRAGAYIVPGPADPSLASQPQSRYASYGADPIVSREKLARPELRPEALSKRLRGRFPVAVAPENSLRFHTIASLAARFHSAADISAATVVLRPEPVHAAEPLIARRVPGVGPMPYERYGFSLLPGWNGVQAAAWPPASAQIAPPGTQWASSEADSARGALPVSGVGFGGALPASAPRDAARSAYGPTSFRRPSEYFPPR